MSVLDLARREMDGCDAREGRHRATRNEHRDAWCTRCGERLLLPFAAGFDPDVLVMNKQQFHDALVRYGWPDDGAWDIADGAWHTRFGALADG